MNEIDKMYELAGLGAMWVEEYLLNNVDTIRMYYNSYNEMINSMMKKNDWTRSEAVKVAKKECKKEYPPFTAEKQLNIIKFLGKTRDFHTCGRYCTALNSEGDSVESLQDKFEESLAGVINELWQDLTKEEKQQIKEILE